MAKYKRWLAVFDNHGDMADKSAVAAMFEFKRQWKPDITIHGGDCFDLRCLRKGASKDEEFEEVGADIDAGKDFLAKLNPDVWLRGNHDERLLDGVKSNNPVLSRFASLAYTEILGCIPNAKVFPYDKRAGIFRMGHLKFIHGYHSGLYAARASALVYGAVVAGHVHSIDSASIPGLDRRTGRVAGCLCLLDMPYNRAQVNTLRQQHGFAYGILLPSGAYQYFQAECTDGHWFYPSEMRSVKHAG